MNLVIAKSSSEEVFRRERVFMTKLNVILVQIVKQEWPVSRPKSAPPVMPISTLNARRARLVAACKLQGPHPNDGLSPPKLWHLTT